MTQAKSGKYSTKALIGICGMLIFGTGTMISSKLLLETTACPDPKYIDDDVKYTHGKCPQYLKKPFEKPWFQTATMFSGMLFCIFGHFFNIWYDDKKAKQIAATKAREQLELEADGAPTEVVTKKKNDWKSYTYIGVPSVFDMIATTIMTIGLVYIDVSIMQMVRGSLVVFCSILNVLFLKRKLALYQWMSVLTTMCAIVIVGVSAILKGMNDTSARPWDEQLFGIFLVLCSQLVQASQIVCEDFLLSGIQAQPLQIVGMEGVWGLVITAAICFPIINAIPGSDAGKMENIPDTFYMFADNYLIIIFSVIYWISILFLNWAGMVVTAETSSVVRSIFEAIRTAAIWVVNLLIFYLFAPNSIYGESWSTYSWIQLGGFTTLIFSSQCYNGYVKFPFFKYPQFEKMEILALVEGESTQNDI